MVSEESLEPEAQALIKRIRQAFRGVSREGGISWSESWSIDFHMSEPKAPDTDQNWEELVEERSDWYPDTGQGGWAFLDAIGFRYYIPAAMIIALRDDDVWLLAFSLTLSDGSTRQYNLDKWSALTLEQARCVKAFLTYMVKQEGDMEDDMSLWQPPLRSHWDQIED